ncbi:maleylpyruvate isomerase N-terminal domain-containing protein [Pseudocnuella soli]|uniref:maleylpyruvate isomerase N-terminal domain-containing protein n=1 Tax=Pseudocnuella soli TaxID=2502779 RepID=UPI0010495CBF|nr:maleylpyruvate isomerase N-terminal domain-containing protein [Pseudocnuella soli]
MHQLTPPIDVAHLLPVLDEQLITLLKSLTPEDWHKQTVAKLWTVKDVAAHLLDGNIRILSMLRDGYFGESANVQSYEELVQFLNRLNADWVQAMKRVSPDMLILLHQITGPMFCRYYQSLNPWDTATFSVAWAGETESKNWMHIAREYTEKFLHRQQIRDAVNKPGIMTRDFFYPFINIFMQALPYTYRHVDAPWGTVVQLTVLTDIGGTWHIQKEEMGWQLHHGSAASAVAALSIDPELAWKLFSKSLRPDDVRRSVAIAGNEALAETALSMVSVMA